LKKFGKANSIAKKITKALFKSQKMYYTMGMFLKRKYVTVGIHEEGMKQLLQFMR